MSPVSRGGQSLTILYALQRNTTLKVTNLGLVSYAGLVTDPNNPNVRYRPGVVNIDPTEPPGTPVIHTINWGGYGSLQATPQPTQIVNGPTTGPPDVDGGEILILPSEDAPNQGAQPASETVYTPAAPALAVESGRGLQPPSSDFLYGPNPNPSATSATPPKISIVEKIVTAVAETAVTIEHVPIFNSGEGSIVTVNPDGRPSVDENNTTTTATGPSKYTKRFLRGAAVAANGPITVNRSPTSSSKSAGNTLDVTA